MNYEKNQYSEGFSICGLIIAGIVLYWGFHILSKGFWIGTWNVWWLGFVLIAIGIAIISSQIYSISNKKKLRNIIKRELDVNPNAKFEELARNTGISLKDVRAISLDLKATGEFPKKTSREIVLVKTSNSSKIDVVQKLEKVKFCPNCGTPVNREEAVFCAYCGSGL